MVVHTDIVRLRAPIDFKVKWKSKTGKVDAIWYDYDKSTEEFITQLVTATQNPDVNACGVKEDLDKELESMPVCQDGVKPQKTTPDRVKMIETFVDHPGFDDRDYLRSRFKNVRSQWLNHQQLVEYNISLKRQGFKRGLQNWVEKHVNPRNPTQIYFRFLVGEIENG